MFRLSLSHPAVPQTGACLIRQPYDPGAFRCFRKTKEVLTMKRNLMQRLCAVTLSTLMLLGTGSAVSASLSAGIVTASAVSAEDNISWSYQDGTLTISGSGKMTDYSTVNYYYEGIETDVPWKDYLSSIRQVVFTGAITRIGNCAFSDCSSLRTIVLPDSLTEIGNSAFARCTSLPYITIPDSVETIGSSAFTGCTSLTSFRLPANLVTLPDSIFSGCKQLCSVELPNCLEAIGSTAFNCCYQLSSITLPEGLKKIDSGAFFLCKALTSITIPTSVEDIARQAFQNCSSLTSIAVYSPFVEYHNTDVFSGISQSAVFTCLQNSTTQSFCRSNQYTVRYLSVPTMTLPHKDVVYTYNGNAHDDDLITAEELGLDEMLLRYEVGDLNSSSTYSTVSTLANTIRFYGYHIPEFSVFLIYGGEYEINYYVWTPGKAVSVGTVTVTIQQADPELSFNKPSLSLPLNSQGIQNTLQKKTTAEVTYTSSNPSVATVSDKGWVTPVGEGSCIITASVPANRNYKEGSASYELHVSEYGYRLENGNAVITDYYGNESSVTIPTDIDGYRVTAIGEKAFSKKNSLKTVVIPQGVTSIGASAFSQCSSLTDVFIPESVTSIGPFAFNECSSLTSVNLPYSLTDLGNEAFYYCTSLEFIHIPDQISIIKESTFYGCTSMKLVVLGSGLKTIGENAFEGNQLLSEIIIPEGVTIIGDGAFAYDTNLTSVTLPKSIQRINAYAFSRGTDATSKINIHYQGSENDWNQVQLGFQPFGYDEVMHFAESSSVPVTAVSLNQSTLSLEKGSSDTLTAVIKPANATDQQVKWSSSNPDVASVKNGVVNALSAGTATITVKSTNGKQASCVVTVYNPLLNKSTVSSKTLLAGQSVTVTAAAGGGRKDYRYAVFYKQKTQTKWTCVQSYKTNPTVVITPKAVTNYTVRVKVRDAGGEVVNKDFAVTVKPALTNLSSVSARTITKGSSIRVSASASGGFGGYQYAVFYKQRTQSKWTCIQSFKTNKSVTITPKAATTYTVRVKIKDAKNNVVNKDFTIKVTAELKNLSEISAQKLVKGKNVTVTCSGSGGTAPYTYAVYYKQRSQTSWTCAQSYSSKTVVRISPKAATVYQIRVKLKDASGKIVNKDFTLTVTK